MIFELIEDCKTNDDDEEEEEKNLVPIQNMEGDIFESVLEFVYCVRTPRIEDKNTTIKLLLAADRLECTDLKLHVESKIVETFLDVSNAADLLVRSDSHSCPLLKETSMKVYASDAISVMESEGWFQIKESPRLLVELLKFCMVNPYVVPDSNRTKKDNSNAIVECLDVTSLRVSLLEANLNIDGNREILVDRLKEHYTARGNTIDA